MKKKTVQINGGVACARISQTMQVSFVSSKWDHERVGDTILLGSRECHAQMMAGSFLAQAKKPQEK